MTEELFRRDAYATECEARLTAARRARSRARPHRVLSDGRRAAGGPRDWLRFEDGLEVAVVPIPAGARRSRVRHSASLRGTGGARACRSKQCMPASTGKRRIRIMRVHTTLHLLCAVIPDVGVTGGSIRDDGTGRLDFNLPEPTLDRNHVEAEVNRLVREDHHPVEGALDQRGRARRQPGPGAHHVRGSAPRRRSRESARHRGRGPAALRRHPRILHRRDRRGSGQEDGEEG